MGEKKMTELLDVIRTHRMQYTLNEIIMKREGYQKMKEDENRHWQYVLMLNLTKEQFQVVNRYLDSQNYFSAEYGEAAYELGLRDGVKLAKEMQKLEELPFK